MRCKIEKALHPLLGLPSHCLEAIRSKWPGLGVYLTSGSASGVGLVINAIADQPMGARLEPGNVVPQPRVAGDNRKFVDDWYLLLHSRNSYFLCFQRTLQQLRLRMRGFVEEEIEHSTFT
ncbi:hypothetical protein BDA99DRAFT_534108 [Phascolomyces articulosus]|uniref:Uncharacterized protein n=1 Tax=Phascolomyces articulosus TaxID=60185 RepID=A0AAD5KI21_9FUNG|nr:hypothetical protein BDA99DRAFT_534108 [Phascolomyces articulosus]